MSDTTDPKLCSLITNCVNHPKISTTQKLSSPLGFFGLEIFHKFAIVGGRIKPIACVVFYFVIKMRKMFYKKPYKKWQIALKTFKKHQNVPTGTHKKRQILSHTFLDEYVCF